MKNNHLPTNQKASKTLTNIPKLSFRRLSEEELNLIAGGGLNIEGLNMEGVDIDVVDLVAINSIARSTKFSP